MINVVQAVVEAKVKKIEQWPVRSNRASQLGHPCERYLVYERTRWQDKALHDVGLQFIFGEGKIHEKAVLRDLEDAGLEVIEQQRAFEWKQYAITGHIDGKIQNNGNIIPFEIKSMSDWAWKSTNTLEDMTKSKAIYMRQYPAQLNLYLIMDEKEVGLFILKNKQSGLLKQIEVRLDYDYTESLIKKAERINGHLANNSLPDRISLDVGACEWCAYTHICLPEHKHEATLLDDPELEGKLDRRGSLKPIFDEYQDLDKEIREKAREKPEVVIGKWKLIGKWIEKKEYTVKAGKYWQTTIKALS